jgi:hypothetical protein
MRSSPSAVTRRGTLALTSALAIVLLAAGCASDQQDVFTVFSGFSSSLPDRTLEVEDIGLSTGWLHNQSGYSVRITSIRFVDPPRALRVLNVLAYSYKDTYDTGIISQAGILYKECPHEYRPHPLDSVTFPPKSDPPWLVVLAFVLTKPGVYHLSKVRISYVTYGHSGWQYQYTNATVTVKNPPLPGPRPLPPSAVCGPP